MDFEGLNVRHNSELDIYISECGRIFRKGKELHQNIGHYGYRRVNVLGRTLYVHRVVADAFCDGKHDGYVVDHIDGNSSNNHASNLQWVSNSQNSTLADQRHRTPRKLYKEIVKAREGGERKHTAAIMLSGKHWDALRLKAYEQGFSTVGGYIRNVVLNLIDADD